MYCHSNDGAFLCNHVSSKYSINSYGLDFINAGKSQSEEPGYYKSFGYLIEQAYNFIQYIILKLKIHPKIFISGASMGGMVCF